MGNSKPSMLELPPRARRIRGVWGCWWGWFGTTSACAENTPKLILPISVLRNYLRVRGEYGVSHVFAGFPVELPPRARRIPPSTWQNTVRLGNYLRVRGEYLASSSAAYTMLELPPRARRIRPVFFNTFIILGTTSACAENTWRHGAIASNCWNYLRVRGEYLLVSGSI